MYKISPKYQKHVAKTVYMQPFPHSRERFLLVIHRDSSRCSLDSSATRFPGAATGLPRLSTQGVSQHKHTNKWHWGPREAAGVTLELLPPGQLLQYAFAVKAATSSGNLLVSTSSVVSSQPIVYPVQSFTGKGAPEQLRELVSASDVPMALIHSYTRTITIGQIWISSLYLICNLHSITFSTICS